MVQLLQKIIWQHLAKLNVHLPFDLEMLIPVICCKNMLTKILNNICSKLSIARLSVIVKELKQLKFPSVRGWLNKLWCFHIIENHDCKKEWEIALHTSMSNLHSISFSEKGRDKYIVRHHFSKKKGGMTIHIYLIIYFLKTPWRANHKSDFKSYF